MPLPPLVDPVAALSADESARTSRHRVLGGFGDEAQRRLAAAHVAIVGAGGLGSPAVLALAAAGVGTLTVVDDDEVELTNLQRQVIHRLADVGSPKALSAVRVAAELSPETRVRPVRERLDSGNAERLLAEADLVLDGSDTFETRRVVASACERLGVPLVWGVVQEFHAQVTVFWSAPPARDAVVLGDLYPQVGEVPSCADVGVLGSLTLQTGAIMATEAIQLITGVGEALFGRILVIDALAGRWDEVPLRPARVPDAAAGRDDAAVTQSTASIPPSLLTIAEMQAARAAGAVLLDVRDSEETESGVIPGSVTLPLATLLADPDAAGPGPFVVICAHGVRAERAAMALRARGVRADVLAGGLVASGLAREMLA